MDISLDTSEFFDFTLDTSDFVDLALDMSEFYDFKLDLLYDEIDYVDIVLDYSEYYDFELVNGFEVDSDILIGVKPIIKIGLDAYEWALLTEDDFVLYTQDDEYLQYLF